MIIDEKKLKRIEELKHNEELLGNCISYLWEIWSNEDLDTIERSFRRLDFTDKDLEYWEIKQEIENIKKELEKLK